jgi:hypothetical protein
MSGDNDQFPWDYSYFEWQTYRAMCAGKMVQNASIFGRTWIYGRNGVLADVFKCAARKLYNENWDGCRDLWKENYRRRKLLRFYTDHPIKPPDPKLAQFHRQEDEREQAEADRFNRAQQKRYEAWLTKRNTARQNDSPSVCPPPKDFC